MHLKKIALRNFRCFENFELELHPQLTVLVGLNGAGKTAILDGIAAGLAPVLRYLSSADQRLSAAGAGIRDTDFRLVPLGKRAGKERWGASEFSQVVVEAQDGLRWDEVRSSSRSQTISAQEKVGQKQLSSKLASILDGLKSNDRALLPVFAYYGAQRGSIDVPKKLHKAKRNYDHPTSALIDALNPRSDFREMLAWFEQEESSELRRNRGQRAEDWNHSHLLQGVREAIRLLLNDEYGSPYFNESHRFVVESKEARVPFQVSQLSQGYQSMLALGMDFSRRLAIGNDHLDVASNPNAVDALLDYLRLHGRDVGGVTTGIATKFAPAVMLVDEIDLHLHPGWQQRVLSDLLRAFPGTQFIVTTHSPQVLSTVKREHVRVLSRGVDGSLFASSPLARTYGELSGDVLEAVMQVDPQPPVPERDDLRKLTSLVDQGEYDSQEVREIMGRLQDLLGENHPQLQRANRSIQRQKLLNSRAKGAHG
jgi:predicted ATP-binding protein involved in virulence